jgi:biopolymer transport protein ExbD
MARRKSKVDDKPVEANLIPIMNIMFLLIPALLLAMEIASMSAIVVQPPKVSAMSDKKQEEEKDQKKPLNLKVFIMEDGFRVSADNQQQGADAGASQDSSKPTIPLAKSGTPLEEYDRWDYAALEAEAKKYKALFRNETVVTISAENNIPMQALVQTMDAMRGTECKLMKALQGEEIPEECLFWSPILADGAG